ncbi:MAG: hypothetical protein O3C34_08105 [Proteobacteria bacterium]|nr:hypothetical protein [Pseudomonadota bacterium]
MVQGPQPAQPAGIGSAQRLTKPPVPVERESPSAVGDDARIAVAASGSARTEKSTTGKSTSEDVVAAATETGKAGAIARNQEQRAELGRAETMLQIALEAYEAIGTVYGGLQALAELAGNENLTDEERATLNAAFQNLKQDIGIIVESTFFDGDNIFNGGIGPDGETVIGLSAVRPSGASSDRRIPPSPMLEKRDGFKELHLLTVASAGVARADTENAAEIVRSLGDSIALRQDGLRRIQASEIEPDRIPGDNAAPFGVAEHARNLSLSVADNILVGGAVPFQDKADRMRHILELANGGRPPETAVTPKTPVLALALKTAVLLTQQSGAEVRGLTNALLQGGEARPIAETLLKTTDMASNTTGLASNTTGSAPKATDMVSTVMVDPAETASKVPAAQTDYHAPSDGGPVIIQAENIQAEGQENGAGKEVAIPSMLVSDPSPGMAGPTMATPSAGPAAPVTMEAGVPEAVRNPGRSFERDSAVHLPATTKMPVEAGVGNIAAPYHKGAVTPVGGGAPEASSVTPLLSDVPMDRLIAVALEINHPRTQANTEIRQTELPKIAELDSARRASGLVHQVRDADPRLDVGFAIVKTVYEAPSDRIQAYGGSIPIEQGGLMAELVRADNILHVADLAIEQIDLHLDYLRGLAEEAGTGASRNRVALDEIFQAVKSNIIDGLAQTTEAQGEKILAGGGGPANGPDGEFVIRLSVGGAAGEAHDIAIPSMRVKDLSPDLADAHIRTRDRAIEAVEHIEIASENTAQTRDMIAEERILIRRLISTEITQQASRSPLARSALGL